MLVHDRRRRRDRDARTAVDRHDAERRVESAGRIQRDAVEADEMRRADQDRDVEHPIAQQSVRVRRDRARYFSPACGAISATRSP